MSYKESEIYKKGEALCKLGEVLKNPKSTTDDIVKYSSEAGLKVTLFFDESHVKETENI